MSVNDSSLVESICGHLASDPTRLARIMEVRSQSTFLLTVYHTIEEICDKKCDGSRKLELALLVTKQLVRLVRDNTQCFKFSSQRQKDNLATILNVIEAGLDDQSPAIVSLFDDFSQANKTGGRIDNAEKMLLTSSVAEICWNCFSTSRRGRSLDTGS